MDKLNTKDILDVLPITIKNEMSKLSQEEKLQEIRLKVNKPLIFQVGQEEYISSYIPTVEDFKNILQKISNYSIYAFEEELKQGYITIKGGHRVGICGGCVIENNKVKTIRNINSLNIRVCKEVIGCGEKAISYIVEEDKIKNTIIISPPKCGKTTLLRDITRILSDGVQNKKMKGKKICVIDERSEIGACFYGIPQLQVGLRTDILDSCPKSEGIMMAIRSMAPEIIVCDEIGTYKDVESILMALNSGVKLITTIHGYGVEDLYKREVFKDITENNVFERAIVLSALHKVGSLEYIYDFQSKEVIWRRE